MIRKSDCGSWSMSMDEDSYYPAFDINYRRLAQILIQSTVCKSDQVKVGSQLGGKCYRVNFKW